MNKHSLEADAAQCRDASIFQQRAELLIAGDHVTIRTEDVRVYCIVHISRHKAWVCPLRDGRQRIIPMGDLRLVNPGSSIGSLLH